MNCCSLFRQSFFALSSPPLPTLSHHITLKSQGLYASLENRHRVWWTAYSFRHYFDAKNKPAKSADLSFIRPFPVWVVCFLNFTWMRILVCFLFLSLIWLLGLLISSSLSHVVTCVWKYSPGRKGGRKKEREDKREYESFWEGGSAYCLRASKWRRSIGLSWRRWRREPPGQNLTLRLRIS